MARHVVSVAALAAALAVFSIVAAQVPHQSIDERVTALERQLASLDTRFGIRSAADPAGTADRDNALSARVAALERTLERLTVDLQRVERQADNALREAGEAQRSALDAERTARDAASRIR